MVQQKGFKRAIKVAKRKSKQKVQARAAIARRVVRQAELKEKAAQEEKKD